MNNVGVATLLSVLLSSTLATAETYDINGHKFTTADGLVIEQIAGPPLVDRPVSADFDEQGRLYVTDSSGSNEPTKVQVKKRPHRIRRLEDTDGDGKFDNSTVYADKLMFPEGAMWYDGSLYVAAPPEIWKFTDVDDDGVADKREVWFDGKTLTGCANDLHGPYLGPDGWFYWCKGAFAEQTYERPGKPPFKTRASHIFRRRPEGGPIEPVMTGGMDNPVELVFTPGGERIFTTTFLVNPNQGLRDGLIHAIYGGVYGKQQSAIAGHPRTGDLMPVMTHLGAAAPCGLARLRSGGLIERPRNDPLEDHLRRDLLATSFNKHNITRHRLSYFGSRLVDETTELVSSDNLDFHPTDVLEDADGSVIIVDTGGWFRLCCPTSQLEKADVLGGIYRVRRKDHQPPEDARGLDLAWDRIDLAGLAQLLGDERFAVRERALRTIGAKGQSAISPLAAVVGNARDAAHRRRAIWALTWIDHPTARAVVRNATHDVNPVVRQAALHSISVRRDGEAADRLAEMLHKGPAFNRRAAAEALGRVGKGKHVATLLKALLVPQQPGEKAPGVDRPLEHSLIYAAMEIGDVEALRKLVNDQQPQVRRAALIALDQMEGGSHLEVKDVQSLLVADNRLLSDTAWWIAQQHPQWGDAVATAIEQLVHGKTVSTYNLSVLSERLTSFSGATQVQAIMAGLLEDKATDARLRQIVLDVMKSSRVKPLPKPWETALVAQLDPKAPWASDDNTLAALSALNQLVAGKLCDDALQGTDTLARQSAHTEVRLRALNLLPRARRKVDDALLQFVCSQTAIDANLSVRSLAVEFLKTTRLDENQLAIVASHLPQTGAMELQPLLSVFSKSKSPQVGAALVDGLLAAPAATALFPDRLQTLLSNFGQPVLAKAQPLIDRIEEENRSKLQRVEAILDLMPTADERRGLRVFQSTKASCIACHRRGYLGGAVGPDLNRIGSIRSERDLLESILFPSLSFVRSYEPVSIVTEDGEVLNGLVREETDRHLILQLDAKKSVQIAKSDIARRKMSDVSIMPAGLEKQLSPQDLADLVKYLKQ